MKTQRLTLAALFIAIATLTGHVFYIPVGFSKCFPIQHTVNVLAAVLLGPWYGVAIAFVTSLLRNVLGTGTLLAFPGSIFGALLAGVLYQRTGKVLLASLGEVVGTGFIGALAAYPIVKLVMGQETAIFFYVVPFLTSTVGGTIIGNLILKALTSLNIRIGNSEKSM
ncbi:MAG: energy coupling factor transporter S component ThiW [bacterium]|jgi:energy coupling factor transporter S component ThiW|nr:energy coupling factor transporter S component ThiW [Bacillota bacterium]HHW55692.1 energy coupling factor transporter S component ThiW [Bacillota bacterium]